MNVKFAQLIFSIIYLFICLFICLFIYFPAWRVMKRTCPSIFEGIENNLLLYMKLS